MKTYSLFLVALIFAACSKSDNGRDIAPPQSITDTTNKIFISPNNYSQGWDTTGNFMATYAFYKKITSSQLLGQYTASTGSGTHRVRYVGTEPLFHSDSVIDRGGAFIGFRINPHLKGKPVFEVYDISTGALYKRYIASKDSVEIDAEFSVFDNYVVPNKTIGEAMLYYINVKQNDAIWYRKN